MKRMGEERHAHGGKLPALENRRPSQDVGAVTAHARLLAFVRVRWTSGAVALRRGAFRM